MSEFSRREMLRALALGGAVVAGELWIPGQRLISIPKQWAFPHGWIVTQEIVEEGMCYLPGAITEMTDLQWKQYENVYVACYQEGGAIRSVMSEDLLTWEHIKPAELYVDA